jgi:hypothetical protein
VPIHLLQWNGTEKGFRSMRELDHSDMTETTLDFDLRDTEHSIVMLAAISCKRTNAPKFLELQTLDEFDGKCKFGCT